MKNIIFDNFMDFTNLSYFDIGLFILTLFLISIVIFLIMREFNCWYWKINERIKLQVEADKDRKDIIRLLLEKDEKGDKESKKEKANFSDKKF